MAWCVLALGLATLGEYVFGWQLGLDELLFRDTAKAYNATPGRMSPYSAAAFGLVDGCPGQTAGLRHIITTAAFGLGPGHRLV